MSAKFKHAYNTAKDALDDLDKEQSWVKFEEKSHTVGKLITEALDNAKTITDHRKMDSLISEFDKTKERNVRKRGYVRARVLSLLQG